CTRDDPERWLVSLDFW
nr:immunoglobulin heavy chain junction region [Macaca mulatta]MOV42623.1 immunoglobulin heavy chain junction region [Macaca mulatta]MOV45366.1 immunoglobulin heavy chain junction region [Macaca mulatta]MOV46779.1 immunoglobulin heavy chain junction region [Macaca mulatta]